MEIEKNNLIIAKFMDHYHIQDGYYRVSPTKCYHLSHLQYHSSWNWLMDVVEKIESLGRNDIVTRPKLHIDNYYQEPISYVAYFMDFYEKHFYAKESKNVNNKIEAIWQACVNFITWYNENSNQNEEKQ